MDLAEDTNGDLVFVDVPAATCTARTVRDRSPASRTSSATASRRSSPAVDGLSSPDGAGGVASAKPIAPAPRPTQTRSRGATASLVVVWDGQTVNGATALPNGNREGFCAVADVLGADQTKAPGPDNPLDGTAEVILVSTGPPFVFNGQTGKLASLDLQAAWRGGPPNVDDFDGDGFPEIGTAFALRYVVIDLQATGAECPAWPAVTDSNTNKPRTPPSATCPQDSDCGNVAKFACNESTGQCVCLHNGWRRADRGRLEPGHGLERVRLQRRRRRRGHLQRRVQLPRLRRPERRRALQASPRESRTRIEYPIVADVDNDGNAEIVFSTTHRVRVLLAKEPDTTQYNAGIEVWGDAERHLGVALAASGTSTPIT